MSKSKYKQQINICLQQSLKEFHAVSGISQCDLAERLYVSPRACSALENGEYGFSVLSTISLFASLPAQQRIMLLSELCDIIPYQSIQME